MSKKLDDARRRRTRVPRIPPSSRTERDETYYVKLGRGGRWEESSVRDGLVRVGFRKVPLATIVSGDWAAARRHLEEEAADRGAVTRDLNALQRIRNSTSRDVWVTFHEGHMLWCRLRDGDVEEDGESRFRRTVSGWSRTDLKGQPLHSSRVPGGLLKVQGFRGTICKVADREQLLRVIDGEESEEWRALSSARSALEEKVADAIRLLHWRDFEVLVDLVFRQLGCRRVGELGRMQRQIDLDLQEPLSGDRYQVQIKSEAGKAELAACEDAFAPSTYRRFYLVVHSPAPSIDRPTQGIENGVVVVGPRRLASMLVDAGLIAWIMDKCR